MLKHENDGETPWYYAASAIVVGLFIATTSLLMVIKGASPVPFWDQWNFITPSYLLQQAFGQHGEHRIVPSLLIFLADMKLAGGTNRVNLAVVFIIQTLLAFLIAWLATRPMPHARSIALVSYGFLALAFTLSAYQWENLLWGFQVAFTSVGLLSTAAFAAVAFVPGISGLLLATVFSASAVFALASGALVPALLVSLAAFAGRKRRDLLILAGLSGITYALFLYGYTTGSHPIARTPSALFAAAKYVLLYLGSPWGYAASIFGGPQAKATAALIAGAIGALSAFGIGVYLLINRKTAIREQWVFLHLLAFLIGSAALTALGRSYLGFDQAYSSRYGSTVLLFWLALILFPVTRIQWVMLLRPAAATLFVLLLATAQAPSIAEGLAYYAPKTDARLALLARINHDELYSRIAPKRKVSVIERSADLRREGLGPYSEKWASWFAKPLSNFVTIAPPERCFGAFDTTDRVQNSDRGHTMAGWAWDRTNRRPADSVVAVSVDGKVIGYADVTVDRPDVPKVVQDVQASIVGWRGFLRAKGGATVTAYALLDNMTAACPLPNPQQVKS